MKRDEYKLIINLLKEKEKKTKSYDDVVVGVFEFYKENFLDKIDYTQTRYYIRDYIRIISNRYGNKITSFATLYFIGITINYCDQNNLDILHKFKNVMHYINNEFVNEVDMNTYNKLYAAIDEIVTV